MNKVSYPWYLTWITIIIACIVCWPVAIVLLVLRVNYTSQNGEKKKNGKLGKTIIGVILIVAGVCSMVVSRILGFLLVTVGSMVIHYGSEKERVSSQGNNYSINANAKNSIEEKFEGSGASIAGDDTTTSGL